MTNGRDERRIPKNIEAFVSLLVEHGNVVTRPFTITPHAGLNCDLRDPIDFGLIRRTFVIVTPFGLAEAHDVITDESTWSSIRGVRAVVREAQGALEARALVVLRAAGSDRIVVAPRAEYADRPYGHLEMLAGAISATGNEMVHIDWHWAEGTKTCEFASPIDFEFVALRFELPPTIEIVDGNIIDTLSGYRIISSEPAS